MADYWGWWFASGACYKSAHHTICINETYLSLNQRRNFGLKSGGPKKWGTNCPTTLPSHDHIPSHFKKWGDQTPCTPRKLRLWNEATLFHWNAGTRDSYFYKFSDSLLNKKLQNHNDTANDTCSWFCRMLLKTRVAYVCGAARAGVGLWRTLGVGPGLMTTSSKKLTTFLA